MRSEQLGRLKGGKGGGEERHRLHAKIEIEKIGFISLNLFAHLGL